MSKFKTLQTLAMAIGMEPPVIKTTKRVVKTCQCGTQYLGRGWHCEECHEQARRCAHTIAQPMKKVLGYMRRYPIRKDHKQIGFMYPHGEAAEYHTWEYK